MSILRDILPIHKYICHMHIFQRIEQHHVCQITGSDGTVIFEMVVARTDQGCPAIGQRGINAVSDDLADDAIHVPLGEDVMGMYIIRT